MLQINVQKIEKCVWYTVTFFFFFRENLVFFDLLGKNLANLIRVQMSYKTASAFCMLHNLGYKHALRIYNINCFYTATMVS